MKGGKVAKFYARDKENEHWRELCDSMVDEPRTNMSNEL